MKTIRLKSILFTIGDDTAYDFVEKIGFLGFETRKLKNRIGVAFGFLGIIRPEEDLRIEIVVWDLGLEDQFKIVRKSYFKNASMAIIILKNPTKEQMQFLSNTLLEVMLFVGCIPIIILDPDNITSELTTPCPDNITIIRDPGVKEKLEETIYNIVLGIINGKNYKVDSKCVKGILDFIENLSESIDYNPYIKLADFGIKNLLELREKDMKENANLISIFHIITRIKRSALESLINSSNVDLEIRKFFAFLLDLVEDDDSDKTLKSKQGIKQ